MRRYRFTAIFEFTSHVLRVCNTLLIPTCLAKYWMSHSSSNKIGCGRHDDRYFLSQRWSTKSRWRAVQLRWKQFYFLPHYGLGSKIRYQGRTSPGAVVSHCGCKCQPGHGRYAGKCVCPSLGCIIDRGEGPSLFFSEAATMMVLQKWRNAGVTDGDLGISMIIGVR